MNGYTGGNSRSVELVDFVGNVRKVFNYATVTVHVVDGGRHIATARIAQVGEATQADSDRRLQLQVNHLHGATLATIIRDMVFELGHEILLMQGILPIMQISPARSRLVKVITYDRSVVMQHINRMLHDVADNRTTIAITTDKQYIAAIIPVSDDEVVQTAQELDTGVG